MDIEITVRCGKRTVSDTGAVKWKDDRCAQHLITYHVNLAGAVEESVEQLRRLLRELQEPAKV